MNPSPREKAFITGYATALQDMMLALTGENSNAKNYDPCLFDDEHIHSYAFDLKDGGRHHPLSDYKNADEITSLMLKEAVNWCEDINKQIK